jgi:cytochrome c553
MYRYIDSKTNRAKGDPVLREDYYQSICSGCHGMDGFRLRTIPPLGDAARSDPWKSLHLILNGHADEKMPSLRAFDLQVLVDILAYVQTLPSGTPAASLARGGRLYDNWRRESDFYFSVFPGSLVFAFDRRHPAYPINKKFANDPEVNWRCKECHGWDYQGASGAYATGKHYTGIKGIRDMVGVPPDRIVAILKDANHQYGDILDYGIFRIWPTSSAVARSTWTATSTGRR